MLTSPRAWSAPPSFQGLGHLPGYDWTEARDVSDDGSVVVGWSQSSGSYNTSGEPFRWTKADGMQSLGFLPGAELTLDSAAYGVSVDGSTIVGGSGNRAFRWTSTDGMQSLVNNALHANAVSADGSVVVGVANRIGAFRWTAAGGMQDLGEMAGHAYALTADGSVIVGGTLGNRGAFRWTTESGMQDLGSLPGGDGVHGTVAHGVNADGSVVVGWSGAPEAFRWTSAGGMQGLGHLSGISKSAALGVSGDGSIIVGSSFRSFSFDPPNGVAFIWDTAHGMRDLRHVLVSDYGLDLAGWQLSAAHAISADGRTIVGTGAHNGTTEAWIATIPEPSSLTLAGMSGAFLLLLRRRQRSRERPSDQFW
jgi:probable HAF family extracellular repeat protein